MAVGHKAVGTTENSIIVLGNHGDSILLQRAQLARELHINWKADNPLVTNVCLDAMPLPYGQETGQPDSPAPHYLNDSSHTDMNAPDLGRLFSLTEVFRSVTIPWTPCSRLHLSEIGPPSTETG